MSVVMLFICQLLCFLCVSSYAFYVECDQMSFIFQHNHPCGPCTFPSVLQCLDPIDKKVINRRYELFRASLYAFLYSWLPKQFFFSLFAFWLPEYGLLFLVVTHLFLDLIGRVFPYFHLLFSITGLLVKQVFLLIFITKFFFFFLHSWFASKQKELFFCFLRFLLR